jgi:hypothetical protein
MAVESIIKHNQAIHMCMKYKIVNYHALASLIRKDVEKSIGRSASTNSMVVAIKRFSDALEKRQTISIPPFTTLKDAKITLTSDIADVTIRPKKSESQAVLKRLVDISERLDEYPDFFKSSNQIKLVADEKEYRSLIRKELGRAEIEQELTGLSKLTLHLSPSAKKDPGFTLFLTELLYGQGITVVHSYVDEDTTILVVNEEDGPRAYEILQREISSGSKAASIPKSKIASKIVH